MRRQHDPSSEEKRRRSAQDDPCADSEQICTGSSKRAQYSVEHTGSSVASGGETQTADTPGHFDPGLFDPRVAMAGPATANSLMRQANPTIWNPNFTLIASMQPFQPYFANTSQYLAPGSMVAPFLAPRAMSSWVGGQANWYGSSAAPNQFMAHSSAPETLAAAAAAAAASVAATVSSGFCPFPMQPFSSAMSHPRLGGIPFNINSCLVPSATTRAHSDLLMHEHHFRTNSSFNSRQYSRLLGGENVTSPENVQEAQPDDGGQKCLPSNRIADTEICGNYAEAEAPLSGRSMPSEPASIVDMASTAGRNGTLNPPASKPRRPLSAYNLYFKDERLRLLAETAASARSSDSVSSTGALSKRTRSAPSPGGRGVGFAQMARVIGAKWRQIGPETRAKYDALAEEEYKRYNDEKQAYLRAQQAALEAHRVRMEATVDDSVRQAYFDGFSAPKGSKRQKQPTKK